MKSEVFVKRVNVTVCLDLVRLVVSEEHSDVGAEKARGASGVGENLFVNELPAAGVPKELREEKAVISEVGGFVYGAAAESAIGEALDGHAGRIHMA